MNSKWLILVLIFAFLTSHSQESKFYIKPSIGLTASQVHGDNYVGFNKLGFVSGAYVGAKFNKTLSLDLGILFIQKGAQKNARPEKQDFTQYYLNLNYIEVPLMLLYKPNRFFITIGASYGYLMGHKESNEFGDLTNTKPFRNEEYSVNIGLGMNVYKNLDFEVRSNNSFITIMPFGSGFKPYYNNALASYFNKGYYNNVLVMAFTYKLIPKKKSESVKN